MTKQEIKTEKCLPCSGGVAPMSLAEIQEKMPKIPLWLLDKESQSISRRFVFKGFAKAVEMANFAAWLGNKMGHQDDVRFGWGYCEIHYTSHEAGGLTQNDFMCAKRLDELLA